MKKSYKGFFLWMVIFLITMVGSVLLPIEDIALLTRIEVNVCILNVALSMAESLAYLLFPPPFYFSVG